MVGSGLVVAAENVPVKTREDLINCTLFAQIAAGKNAGDPKDVSEWYDEYFKASTIIGWAQSDTQFEEYKFTSKNAEAHQAIMKVLTVLLGPQAAALVVVKTVLDALQSMNSDSPWITSSTARARPADPPGSRWPRRRSTRGGRCRSRWSVSISRPRPR